MTLWQELEQFLEAESLEWFTSHAVAEYHDVAGYEASRMIEAYLDAQASPRVDTAYVLHRMAGTRTTSTRWVVSAAGTVVDDLGAQWASDARCRVQRAIRPTLAAISKANPRARRKAEALAAHIDTSLELIGALLDE